MKESAGGSKERVCYRCGQPEQGANILRLLPGSTHITLCPACYQIVWGWREKPLDPPSSAPPDQRLKER